MATEAVKENKIVTQEGTELVVKPLTIRSLRKFMEVIDKLNVYQREQDMAQREYEKAFREYNEKVAEEGEDAGEAPEPPETDEFAIIEIMLEAAQISLEKHNPEFAKDKDRLEDELDIHVMNEILEIAGGIKLGDPNLGTPMKA